MAAIGETTGDPGLSRLANKLLGGGVLLLLLGLCGAYLFDEQLSLGLQVGAHALTILGPALLKVGYVMHLLAQQKRRGGLGLVTG
ncbi:MAG: hypothetical protein V4812_04290 [Pseudomonadota bacterium]